MGSGEGFRKSLGKAYNENEVAARKASEAGSGCYQYECRLVHSPAKGLTGEIHIVRAENQIIFSIRHTIALVPILKRLWLCPVPQQTAAQASSQIKSRQS